MSAGSLTSPSNTEVRSCLDLRWFARSLAVSGDLTPFDRWQRRWFAAELARERGIRAAPEEVQAAVDEWRYGLRLERVEDTEEFLRSRGLTLADVAQEMEARLLLRALRSQVVGDRVEAQFAANRLDFDEVDLSWIYVKDEGLAEELAMQVSEEGGDFAALARAHSEDEKTRMAGGYSGRVRRGALPRGIGPLVFASEQDHVVGPIKVPGGFGLYLVLARHPTELTPAIREEIEAALFKPWLKREMHRAGVSLRGVLGPVGAI